MLTVTCSCGEQYEIAEQMVGYRLICERCHATVEVALPETPQNQHPPRWRAFNWRAMLRDLVDWRTFQASTIGAWLAYIGALLIAIVLLIVFVRAQILNLPR